jgi:hypothetical protein
MRTAGAQARAQMHLLRESIRFETERAHLATRKRTLNVVHGEVISAVGQDEDGTAMIHDVSSGMEKEKIATHRSTGLTLPGASRLKKKLLL